MRKTEAVYSVKWLVWGLIGFGVLCASMKATGGAGFLLIFPFLLAAFVKNRSELLLYAILATAVLTVTNGFIAPKDNVYSISARLVYGIASGVLILQSTAHKIPKILAPILSIFLYVGFQALASSQGWQPLISYLKLFLFVIVFLAFWGVACTACVDRQVRPQTLRSVVLVFACFLILGSLALIPFPGIGKIGAAQALEQGLDVESVGLFMGVTFQPQALGPAVSVIATVLLADLLFSIRRWEPLYLTLLVAAPVLVYYTSSRTAMGTWLAGMSFTTFVFMCANGVGSRWKGRALGTLFIAGMICGVALFATPEMRDKVLAFAFKVRGEDAVVTDTSFSALTSSRQGLMDVSMANFADSPLIGNGFQVSKQMEGLEIQSWTQLLSAPIEKGVWVTAVLEEGGILGMFFFVFFLLVSFYGLLTRRAYIGASAFFVLTIANLGEFTFFSMSSIGGIVWAFVFTGLALDAQRLRAARQARLWGRAAMPGAYPLPGPMPAGPYRRPIQP